MADFEERIYDLGAAALAEQERQVGELRSRGATLLAAGAVIASLLARPTFSGDHPSGMGEIVAAVVGILASGALLIFVVLLLVPRKLGFSVNARATYQALWDQQILQQPMVDLALADAFEERREENARVVRQLVALLGCALCALTLETAGLATAAALAS